MILPSLLEYSNESLLQKLALLGTSQSTAIFRAKNLSLHLDFVLPQFAKDRKVMTSIGLETVLKSLEGRFGTTKLSLSLHLMGTSEDLADAYDFFETYKPMASWSLLVLVPEKFTTSFRALLNSKYITVGVWYDLGEWENKALSKKQTFLLMTVRAGKSGQIRSETSKQLAIEKAKTHNGSHFIVDGGWSINETVPRNIDVVSYSSFWSSF